MAERFENPFFASDTGIVYVSTSVPRKCGIATFCNDLSTSISQEMGGKFFRVVALTDASDGCDYPPTVTFEVRKNMIRDYARAAEYINGSPARIVSLQHEFGIFGGDAGKYLSVMLALLKKPVVTTLHTVLRNPSSEYREALEDVIKFSHRLVAMGRTGVEMLTEIYGVPKKKISLIPHGVHDLPFVDPNFYKDQFNVEGRTVLLTFGLLGPNKGIETVLEALPLVVEKHPDVVYIILGATHPEVKRSRGEEYRLFLERKVRDFRIEDNVLFHNRFVELQELSEYICCADIYVTPYLSKEQVTSGTLAYALGMGKAVISTPYWHAEELLSGGRGVLVGFRDSKGVAKALIDLIEDPVRLNKIRKKAYEYGRTMVWKEVGRQYMKLFREVLREREESDVKWIWTEKMSPQATLPEIKLDHLLVLSDDVGLLQHAPFGVPDRDRGYSCDDVGRGLAALMIYYNQQKDQSVIPLITKYLSFLKHTQTLDGHFHNFVAYDRHFRDERGSDDTLGRALWGLGTVVRWGPNERMRALAQNIMETAAPRIVELRSPRAMAYTIIGLYHLLQKFEGASLFRRLVIQMADALVQLYKDHRSDDWRWFEDILADGNAKIPEALFRAYQVAKKKEFLSVASESLDFITTVEWNGVYFELIGNEGWYPRGGIKAPFGQQPIDAGYLVDAYLAAFRVTDENRYLDFAQRAFEWFLGRNRLNVALYDFADGSVADGIDSDGVRASQGAESVVCYLLAVLALSEIKSQRMKLSYRMDAREVPTSKAAGRVSPVRGG